MDNEKLADILERAGVRPTANRIMILRSLMQADGPASMGELEARLDTVDKSGISRTLALLCARHLVHTFEDGHGVSRYELCHAGADCDTDDDIHAHFFCQECGRVYCLDDVTVALPQLPDGFLPRSVNFMIKGVCADCAAAHSRGV